jgi:hypothetical protein
MVYEGTVTHTMTRITMDNWEETYKPISNHLDDNASFQDYDGVGIMFETYGAEKEFVKSQPANKIWTCISEDDDIYIVAGWHVFDRVGYFVTEQEWTDEHLSIKVN